MRGSKWGTAAVWSRVPSKVKNAVDAAEVLNMEPCGLWLWAQLL